MNESEILRMVVAKTSLSPLNSQYRCGISMKEHSIERQKIIKLHKGDTKFGEIPWQAAILRKQGESHVYICSASLIDESHILTAAHCVNRYKPTDLTVRLGEWNVDDSSEFYAHQEVDVVGLAIHPDYLEGNLANDIALIRILYPVDVHNSPHVLPVCVPAPNSETSKQNCIVTGWGKDSFGKSGIYQSLLKKVEVPLIPNSQCQDTLKRTRLGSSFKLHPGMMCAGGEPNKDACKGDGGGPLTCLNREGKYDIVGIVSWGIGCGKPGIPGVYTNVQYYMPWIKEVTTS